MATAAGDVSNATPGRTGHVAESIRDAVARRTALRIVGTGRWLDAGRPVRADTTLSLAPLAGIVEYVAGDLTLTARAGTTLGEIARATAANGQWLTLDPFGDDSGTLGATVATAAYGPLATAFGTPRDIVLGTEFVTGTGSVVRGGGRVVKNVAGFDLVRLVTGSWGTIGVVTEVTVRLRARPEVDRTVAVAAGVALQDVAPLGERLRTLPFTPFAAELVNAPLAVRLGLEPRPWLLARLGGTDEAVRAHRAALESLGELREVPDSVWPGLRAEPPGAASLRLSRLPSRFAATWADTTPLTDQFPDALVHGAPLRGVVRCVVPNVGTARDGSRGHALHGVEERLARALGAPFDGSRIFERMPGAIWRSFSPSAVTDRLSQGIRAAYDPHCLLNPGILGDCPDR